MGAPWGRLEGRAGLLPEPSQQVPCGQGDPRGAVAIWLGSPNVASTPDAATVTETVCGVGYLVDCLEPLRLSVNKEKLGSSVRGDKWECRCAVNVGNV